MNRHEFETYLVTSVIYWHRHGVKPTVELCVGAVMEKAEQEYGMELLAFEVTRESLLEAVYKTERGYVARSMDTLRTLLDSMELTVELSVGTVKAEMPKSLGLIGSILTDVKAWKSERCVPRRMPLPQHQLWHDLSGSTRAWHTMSGRFSSSSPNQQNIPIRWGTPRSLSKQVLYAHQYGFSTDHLGALRLGAAAHRCLAERSLQPVPRNPGDPGGRGERAGAVSALHQADGRGRGQPGLDHRKARHDCDGSGRGVRLVGAEQGPVSLLGRTHAGCDRRRGWGVHPQRGKRRR